MGASLIVSIIALIVSATTAWFTLFHRGEVRLTKPNIFAIVPRDGLVAKCPKIFLRALLYSTSRSGRAVESMFIKIHHGGSVRKFQYWAFGEREMLVPGSGLFVGPDGHEANHHFTPIEDNASYDFKPGAYSIEVFGKAVGMRGPKCLTTLSFELTEPESLALKDSKDSAVFFWWDAEKKIYVSKIDRRPKHI